MKTFYSILSAMVAVVLFAPLAVADPGTTWDKKINNPGRFTVLSQFNGEAVLDRETGRVWEQSPDTARTTWFNALNHCHRRQVGGRNGWRLPTIEELASLVNPNTPGGKPFLPPGHPFNNVQSSDDTFQYWSATTFADNTNLAWTLGFDVPVGNENVDGKGDFDFVWCVRGGQGIDG
jgi:hypothetical protein